MPPSSRSTARSSAAPASTSWRRKPKRVWSNASWFAAPIGAQSLEPLVEDVEQEEGDQRVSATGGLDAAVAGDDLGHRAVVGAVVDQVQVAEDPVDHRGDRQHHLVADQG